MQKRATSDNAGLIVLFFFLYGAVSQYLLISLLAGIVMAIIVASLWKPFVPPILVYIFAFQFMQIFGAVLYADIMHESLDLVFKSRNVESLVALTLMQTALMALVAARLFKIKYDPDLEALRAAAQELDTRKILMGYVICSIVFPALTAATMSNPSLAQLVQSFAVIRKAFLMMLLFMAFLTNTKYKTAIIVVFVLEFILSFASYFSSFKDVFLYIFLVYLTVNPTVRAKTIFRMLPVGAVFVILLAFWSTVKVGYREFLNNGSRLQQISVSQSDALSYLANRAVEYNADSLQAGGEILLHRIQYMEQYAAVYSRVPSIIPYANGNNLMSSLIFLSVPRSFVDKKAILDPSTKSSYYTGRSFANAEQGTSISMGYFCDLYIDYGLWLMTIPLVVIAYFIGKASSYVVNHGRYNIIFTYSLFIGVFLSLGSFESDIIFYLGSVRNYVVVVIIGYIFVFPWIMRRIKAQ